MRALLSFAILQRPRGYLGPACWARARSCSRIAFSARIRPRTVSGSSAARAVAVIAISAGTVRSMGHLFMRVASVGDAGSAARGARRVDSVGLSVTRRCENPLLTLCAHPIVHPPDHKEFKIYFDKEACLPVRLISRVVGSARAILVTE